MFKISYIVDFLDLNRYNISMIVIGDIAGQYETLKELVSLVPNRYILSLGDMVDRGPDSKSVISFFKKHKAILGNHEHMMIDAWETSKFLFENGINSKNFSKEKLGKYRPYYNLGLWLEYNGGGHTLNSYVPGCASIANKQCDNFKELLFDVHKIIPEEDILWLKSLPKFYEYNNYLMTHAPIAKKQSLQDVCDLGEGFYYTSSRKSDRSVLWNITSPVRKEKVQVFGHISYEDVLLFNEQYPNGIRKTKTDLPISVFYAFGIDTSKNNVLTAMDLDQGVFYQKDFK